MLDNCLVLGPLGEGTETERALPDVVGRLIRERDRGNSEDGVGGCWDVAGKKGIAGDADCDCVVGGVGSQAIVDDAEATASWNEARLEDSESVVDLGWA